ncbi:MAG: hypothetical protein FWG64_03970 [Firmicutes bacterium]|nr:hypothetical protein [Bacillota bacterium]
MFLTLEETIWLIKEGKILHIAGSEQLLRQLPKGSWVGGSTEYFMTKMGGKVSSDRLFVTQYNYKKFSINTYDTATIQNIATETPYQGFTIALIPAESAVHREFAANAMVFKDMFVRALVGWITGTNPDKPEQLPIAINGSTGEIFTDKAVALSMETKRTPVVNIVNIFEPSEKSPIITFDETLNNGFMVENCLINGTHSNFAEFITLNDVDTKLPLIGQFSGALLNTSIWGIEDGKVKFASPIFNDVEYRFAKPVPDYEAAFVEKLSQLSNEKPIFSCNCIGNFWYGNLENKLNGGVAAAFAGPVTFGEIAYQMVNQTLVYVTLR